MIELGLSRITALVRNRPRPWKAIHVAGTNGKGSICAYITAMLHAAGIRCGRFTTPHLIDRWDSITIDERPISKELFEKHERLVQARNEAENIGASEFELLTATAFEAFTSSNVQVGVVEVGMGGRLDATNVLEKPLVTVISKIGLDHQAFLGDTIEAIAKEKAGILKPGAPCVIDGTNKPSVIEVIQQVAQDVGAGPIFLKQGLPKVKHDAKRAWKPRFGTVEMKWRRFIKAMRTSRAQRTNISCAYEAVNLALPHLGLSKLIHGRDLVPAVMTAGLPGRLQRIDLGPLVGREQPALLDGAHNTDSAHALEVQVFNTLRLPLKGEKPRGVSGNDGWKDFYDTNPVAWVLAFTAGKDVAGILREILLPGDSVFLTRFGPVDGMPWVKPMDPSDIEHAVKSVIDGVHVETTDGLLPAIQGATTAANGGPLVIAGSLYLVSDVLRLLRSAESS